MPRKKHSEKKAAKVAPLLAEITGGEQLANILAASAQADLARAAVIALRETLKQARGGLLGSEKQLADLLREARDGLPLQNAAKRTEPGTRNPENGSPPAAETPVDAGQGAAPSADDNVWRAVRLDSLTNPHIKGRFLMHLAEHDPAIVTLGDWTDWVAAKGDFCIRDLPGLGEAARVNIDEATAAFWARRTAAAVGPAKQVRDSFLREVGGTAEDPQAA